MKFVAFVLLGLVSINAWASADLEKKVSLKVKDATASEFMKEVSKQTKVNFIVDGKLKYANKTSIEVKDTPLKKVMDGFALQHGVAWTVEDDNSIRISQKR